jgi:hypothetical protein
MSPRPKKLAVANQSLPESPSKPNKQNAQSWKLRDSAAAFSNRTEEGPSDQPASPADEPTPCRSHSEAAVRQFVKPKKNQKKMKKPLTLLLCLLKYLLCFAAVKQ